jgi:protein gp37
MGIPSMSEQTKIEWTDATWNPVAGCEMIAPECAHCYAIYQVHRMASNPNPQIRAANEGLTERLPNGRLNWTGVMRTLPDRLTKPLKTKKPTMFFVNSLSDLFHEDVPFEYVAAVFGIMAASRQHTFQILTKRPGRAAEFFRYIADRGRMYSERGEVEECFRRVRQEDDGLVCGPAYEPATVDWPLPNVWIGTSVGSRQRLPQIDIVREVPAVVRFLSVEPLLEDLGTLDLTGIHWVIIGGESGPGARPCNVEWIRSVKDQCVEAGIPVFVKQLGSQPFEYHVIDGGRVWLGQRDRKGGDMSEWPVDLRIRQFPTGGIHER